MARNIKIGGPYKNFQFWLEQKDGEINLTCNISSKKNKKKQFFWLKYSNAQYNRRVWKNNRMGYHFCLRIPYIITIDTAHVGRKLFDKLNLTMLFNMDFHVYTSGDSVQQMN